MIILILFFLSLIGIILMIGNKLVLIKNGQVVKTQHLHPFALDLQRIKYSIFKNIKRFGYKTLLALIRFFVKFSNFIKIKSKILIKEFEKKFQNNGNFSSEVMKKKEVSKYLKVISEYRHKIREMKHKIKEEEGIE